MKEPTEEDDSVMFAVEHYKKTTTKDMTKEGNFIILAIECYKRAMNLNGKEVIELFTKHNIFDRIRKSYFIYHIEREQNMIDDINEYIENSKT
jgi:hypothetical protein